MLHIQVYSKITCTVFFKIENCENNFCPFQHVPVLVEIGTPEPDI